MEDILFVAEDTPNINYLNVTCDNSIIPTATEYLSNLGAFGGVFVGLGSILTMATILLAVEASYHVLLQRESKFYKRNCVIILAVYPIASTCSLIALSAPRTQLLSEALTQMALTIAMYRLYLLIIDVGRRKAPTTTTTPMLLRVGPCCCWPCLPFPILELTAANLSWLQVIVLQFPIIQGLMYTVFLLMYMEDPMIYTKYNIFLQPLCVTSILLALYGLTIAVMSLKDVNPEAKLRLKAAVTQFVLLFSKLQGSIIKLLPATGLFPCNAPITPQLYANFTYNALMLIEMLLLCYAARYVYRTEVDSVQKTVGYCVDQELPPTSPSSPASAIARINLQRQTSEVVQQKTTRIPVDTAVNNNNNNNNGHVQLSICLGNVTA